MKAAVEYYLKTWKPWNGLDSPIIEDDNENSLYLSIDKELLESRGADKPEPFKTLYYTLPTPLTIFAEEQDKLTKCTEA